MTLSKRYRAQEIEPELQRQWEQARVHQFDPKSQAPVFAIDTPPPSVSGSLHLGHAYSYTHADFFARYRRMRGDNVFYPMGFDDNGLPTERLVERTLGRRAQEIGRAEFIRHCLTIGATVEAEYESVWRRLGLSIDWHFTYRTIDERARRTAQKAFLDLLRQGHAFRQQAPVLWCPECRTAIAQAELDDLERETAFYTLAFTLDDGTPLPIATTRPELLPACVSVFVHPDDSRADRLNTQSVTIPLFERHVPIRTDPAVDPAIGTGIVMCCTFGDAADVVWWRTQKLPLVEAIGPDGHMTDAAGPYAGMKIGEARRQIVADLQQAGALISVTPAAQSVRVHERCDTPVETLVTRQWFIRILDNKARFLSAGDRIRWHPEHMHTRYRQWVENLTWDWCISRQRYFGVPFPIWYCDDCGEIIPAAEEDLPVDPAETAAPTCAACGGSAATPEADVLDTWATSSLTPQIVGQWLDNPELYRAVYPMSLRPQAHEIIRTWAFYTIVQAAYHTGEIPWSDVAISGWGLKPEGEKLSKSRGGGASPLETLEAHSADAVRYWAASTALGKDAVISEERIQAGGKLVNKLWNVARFAERFLTGYAPDPAHRQDLTPADRWILARCMELVATVTSAMDRYDYAQARSEIELFFWTDLADNYLEMAKKRLYEQADGESAFALYFALLNTIKLLAPLLPHVTEAIFQALFAATERVGSLHRSAWPLVDPDLSGETAVLEGRVLVEIASAVRRYKSEHTLSLGAPLARLQVSTNGEHLAQSLLGSRLDLASITRAEIVEITPDGQDESPDWVALESGRACVRIHA